MARVAIGRIEDGNVVSDGVGFLFLLSLAKPVAKAVVKAAKKGKLAKQTAELAEAGAKGAKAGVKSSGKQQTPRKDGPVIP